MESPPATVPRTPLRSSSPDVRRPPPATPASERIRRALVLHAGPELVLAATTVQRHCRGWSQQRRMLRSAHGLAVVDDQLARRLQRHQWLGFKWMYRVANGTFRGCILADDPGLGKTLQALALIEALIWSRQAARVLVVCRYCDVSVPGDGRGWRGRTLGRGIRPAFNPLLKRRPRRDATRGRAAGRRSGPHGRIRTIPGADDIYRDRTARSRSWLRP